MYFPFVEPRTKKTRRQVVQFGGLNRTQDFREGELVDGYGLSSREWPCLTQRLGRKRLSIPISSSTVDLFAWDKLVMVDSGKLYYGGERVGELNPWDKKLAAVNTKLCIFPDKKYLDRDTQELGDLQATAVNQGAAAVSFGAKSVTLVSDVVVKEIAETHLVARPKSQTYPSDQTGFIKTYEEVQWDQTSGAWRTKGERECDLWAISENAETVCPGRYVLLAPAEEVGAYQLNVKTVETHSANQKEDMVIQDYAEDAKTGIYGEITKYTREWVKAETDRNKFQVYIHVALHDACQSNPNLEKLFLPGDMVTVSGSERAENNRDKLRVEAVDGYTITFTLSDEELFTEGEETGSVKLCREVPDLDFICEHENRLIGLSNKDKTIYISALGDPRNFYDYRGLSVSSAYIPVGSAGDFTGCISYGGNVLIFKEDCIIRLMGDYDGNYATYTDQVAGLQAGCDKSLVIINEVLYYKGREGVYAYTGSTPRLTSAALGDVSYQYARAGTDGRRYYISVMREDTEKYELLVYDTQTGLWMKEEDRRVDAFARQDGQLYMAGLDGIYILGEGGTDREADAQEDDPGTPIAWEATFAPFDETVHERKYPSRLLLRLELGEGAWVEAELSRDGGPFQHIWTSHGRGQGPTAVIPIRPGRCDRYQIRLKGEGKCLIRSMAREFSMGGVR